MPTSQPDSKSVFTPEQIAYLQSQRLGRLATVGRDGQPHVVPVSYRYNPDLGTIDIGGRGFGTSKKYRDVQRNPRVAFVVDDVPSVNPPRVRGIEIRGDVEVFQTGGTEIRPNFDPQMIRLTPKRIVSWDVGEGH